MSLVFYVITHFITAFISLFLGIKVFLVDKSNKLNLSFIFLALVVSIWSSSYGIWLLSNDFNAAFFWARMLNFGATLIPLAYILWISYFLKNINKILIIYITLVTIFFASFSFSDFYINDLKAIMQFPYWPQLNWLYALFLLASWSVVIVYSITTLTYEYVKRDGESKQQIKYIIIGSVIGFFGGSMNFLLMMNIQLIEPFGSSLVVAYPIFFAYAMARHKMMNVNLVFKKTIIYSFSAITILVPMFFVYHYVLSPLEGFWYNLISDVSILLIAIIVYPWLNNFYKHFANKYLFTSVYDSAEKIDYLAHEIAHSLDLGKIIKKLIKVINSSIHPKRLTILLYDKTKKIYYFEDGVHSKFENINIDSPEHVVHRLYNYFGKNNEAIRLKELMNGQDKSVLRACDFLKDLGVKVLSPLNTKDKSLGLILLSEKETRDSYNKEDFKLLNILSRQVAILLENAILYTQAMEFNTTLKTKVKQAISRINKQNKELKQLDKMKSEFVSVASHQLRTPLTATKWALEFLSGGDNGKLNKEQVETVGELTVTNQKLIKLVNELLNISRIDEGRLRIEPKPTNLIEMIKEQIKEFYPLIKHKKLKLIEHYDKNIPSINLDQDIISKAISNFFSNAIKYNRDNKKLTVRVEIEKQVQKGSLQKKNNQDSGNVLITIQDEGIGIPQKEQEHIFKKFYRASNAATSNTEGTGLGMYIAKTAIEKSGGKVWFESKEDIGTTFFITIPLKGSKEVKGEKGLA